MSTTRTVSTARGYRAHVTVEPGRLVVQHETQHCWLPSIWEPRERAVLRTRAQVEAYTRHRGLRLVLLAAWVEVVALGAQRAEAVRA